MGKRELLLIVAFAVLGLVAWRLTAPPPEAGNRGFSLERVLNNIRSELQSHDTPADVATSARVVASATAARVELDEFTGPLIIEGIDGDEIVAELRGTAYGVDETQAKAFAAAITLRIETSGETVQLHVDRPEMSGRPRLELGLKVPRRLTLKVAVRSGRLEARGLGGLEYDARRTTVLVTGIRGLVKGDQNAGDLEISDVGTLELSARRADVRIERVSGSLKAEADGGHWLVRDVTGNSTLDSERADLSLERLGGDLTFKASDGSLTLRDEVGDVRGESQRCRLTFRLGNPGTVDVTTEDAPVELQVDAAVGGRYDLRAEDARVRAPEGSLRVETRDTVTEASGTVGPGGRTVKVRSRRGDITVRP